MFSILLLATCVHEKVRNGYIESRPSLKGIAALALIDASNMFWGAYVWSKVCGA